MRKWGGIILTKNSKEDDISIRDSEGRNVSMLLGFTTNLLPPLTPILTKECLMRNIYDPASWPLTWIIIASILLSVLEILRITKMP